MLASSTDTNNYLLLLRQPSTEKVSSLELEALSNNCCVPGTTSLLLPLHNIILHFVPRSRLAFRLDFKISLLLKNTTPQYGAFRTQYLWYFLSHII